MFGSQRIESIRTAGNGIIATHPPQERVVIFLKKTSSNPLVRFFEKSVSFECLLTFPEIHALIQIGKFQCIEQLQEEYGKSGTADLTSTLKKIEELYSRLQT